MDRKLALITGRSNPLLSQKTAGFLNTQLIDCAMGTYSDGETSVEIKENIRGNDVFVIQSTSSPGNDNLMELLITIDALKRASAYRITAVIPYFGYSRQDRKVKPRVPITAKLVSDLIVTAGADRVLTVDLHAGQIMGFFNVPVDNLYARPFFISYFKNKFPNSEDICIVSPDAGGVARARSFAKRLPGSSLAIIDKRRAVPGEVAEMNVVGSVEGKIAIIVDDMVDTGGTLAKAASSLQDHGALDVIACCSHSVLSGKAKQNIEDSVISKIILTDTIHHDDLQGRDKFKVLSVASLLSEAIARIHTEDSVSTLFDMKVKNM